MTDLGTPTGQPILLTLPLNRRGFSATARGSESARLPSRNRQAQRLTPQFDELLRALEQEQIGAQTSLPATDPELVIVFETRGSVADVFSAARTAGIEILMEVEDEFEPDDDFQKNAKRPADVPGFLHLALANATAVEQLRRLWGTWTETGTLPRGLGGKASGLSSLFSHLKDVRPWGPQDRIRSTGLAEAIADRLAVGITQIPIQAELWYYQSAARRQLSEASVRAAIEAAGGSVLDAIEHDGFGYHGLAGVIPTAALQPLIDQGPGAIQLLRSNELFFLRPGGQSVLPSADAEVETPKVEAADLPTGSPIAALLDGLPVVNHVYLDGRITVFDPDGLEDETYEAVLRKHGTQMASLIVWGDLANGDAPLSRPLLVRPVLKPDVQTQHRTEAIPDGVLLPDLMVRVFRELRGTEDQPGTAPSVRVVNLSVCDPHSPFDTIPSAWARALDWLAFEYGMLVLVSAGNHPEVQIDIDRATFEAADSEERKRLTLEALGSDSLSRRLLNPAESINALTVGALHSDSSGEYIPGFRIDPLDGAPLPSPVSAMGRGFRRSVKPDVFAPGGRQLYDIAIVGPATETVLRPNPAITAPGLRAASPTRTDPVRGEVHVRGTSGATALITRRAAQLAETVNEIRGTVAGFEDRHIAPALKALLVHGAEWPDQSLVGSAAGSLTLDRYFAYGYLATNLVLGCPANRVTLLAVGDLSAREEEDVLLPLPPGLGGLVGKRRVTATLAWLSPINWGHRQYRRAKLAFKSPDGPLTPVIRSKQIGLRTAQRGTVQHQIYEGEGAVPLGQDDEMVLTVQCFEQAGGLNGLAVPYAAVISLEVAATLGVDVYAEVASRIRQPVAVAART